MLVCPLCRTGLRWEPARAVCRLCEAAYPLRDGVIVFADPATDDGYRKEDRQREVAFWESRLPEFETSRPHGTPMLYGRLLEQKIIRSLRGLGSLHGRTVLSVCGGSGMEAEFLARAGATVIVLDIAQGAALRAQVRARRYGLDIVSIVADVERLPFGDESVDVCYVHDGLHHLRDPQVGIEEMSRVASQALSINEPADALATELAVRLGFALEEEEAGNRVARLHPGAVVDLLERNSFRIVHLERYLMYYKHEPGKWVQALSRPRVEPAALFLLETVNRIAGGMGNKLTIQAERIPRPATG
jgi:SAM-dependent methyltransferase